MAELPLVLLHAYPLDARMWNPVREALAARTRVVTPDQRGLGRTPLPATDREPSLDDAAVDVVAMLDKLGLDRVVLGGCSMGGYVTMAVLRRAPERVGGLVFIDTRAAADTEQARAERLAVADRAESEGIAGWLADDMLPKLLSEHARSARPELVATVRELIESQRPSGVAWALRAMAARPDSTEALRAADVPALVIVGEQDSLTPPELAGDLADALPRSRLVVIPGAGHLTPMEAPERVGEAVLDWLA
ncbi:pimeloyl-ACP methyl ester carboxylesterase [Saccharomonospora amisosensis]|uniref:Pimeloyl-ACP methyl ester carboxylesterase n=1 Tax=Saccharomonospora amisosensis TaxID=1128677 RepID=A0A7X5ZPN6_9PSEU|nr:alpha/beta fold hydrolase [Saccharomonospora amisosensis]NIJ10914.1 pimeloyl-ACP methyl ester carboxylesterase [Saccharomonospora amisosensis]